MAPFTRAHHSSGKFPRCRYLNGTLKRLHNEGRRAVRGASRAGALTRGSEHGECAGTKIDFCAPELECLSICLRGIGAVDKVDRRRACPAHGDMAVGYVLAFFGREEDGKRERAGQRTCGVADVKDAVLRVGIGCDAVSRPVGGSVLHGADDGLEVALLATIEAEAHGIAAIVRAKDIESAQRVQRSAGELGSAPQRGGAMRDSGIESKGMILMARQNDGKMRFITPAETLSNGAEIG